MLTLLVILAVAGLLFVAASLATRDGDVLVDAPPDRADVELPAGPIAAEDLDQVRFGLVLRGYRMSEVDLVLDRLGEELRARDERIAELEGRLAAAPPPPAPAAEAGPPSPAVEPSAVWPAGSPALESFGFPELEAPERAEPGVPEAVEEVDRSGPEQPSAPR